MGPQGGDIAKFSPAGLSYTVAGLSIGNLTSAAGVFIPSLIGLSNAGRLVGLYVIGEPEDVIPTAADAGNAAIVLDVRNKTGVKLVNSNILAVTNYTQNLLLVKADGSVGIGTTDTKGYKLAVNGSGIFTRLKVKEYANWPDFVFRPDYQLPSLLKIEQYISLNQHLPDIPSASEVEKDGIDLGEMNKKLLQKIEEQMLYIIEMNKKVEALTSEMQALKEKVGPNDNVNVANTSVLDHLIKQG